MIIGRVYVSVKMGNVFFKYHQNPPKNQQKHLMTLMWKMMIKRWICWGSILRENHIPGFYMVLRTWQP
jgi:hypothetical protein